MKKPFLPAPNKSGSNPPAGESYEMLHPPASMLGVDIFPPGGAQPPSSSTFSTPKAPSYSTGKPLQPSSAKPEVGAIFSTPRPHAGSSVGLSFPAQPEEQVTNGTFSTPRPPAGLFVGPSSPARPDELVMNGVFGTTHPPVGSFNGPFSPAQPEGQVTNFNLGTPRPPAGLFIGQTLPARPKEQVKNSIFSTPHPTASPARPEEQVTSGIFGTHRLPAGTTGGNNFPNVVPQLSIPGNTNHPPEGNVIGQVTPPGSNAGGKLSNISKVPLGIERPGLPDGITEADVMKLLYRFNYTVGFHGHNEEGYRNGDKAGGYFVNGRNGISTQVKYVANEFGYQPNITFIPLGLDSPETPKEDTEKNYGLKGYAFEWFSRR
jgi:hypothetical protein